MRRVHFFEAIERKIDFQKEYIKLEEMCAELHGSFYLGKTSINIWIENNFRNWGKRLNYTSFAELREQVGFSAEYTEEGCYIKISDVDINKYILFCEMILNITIGLEKFKTELLFDAIKALYDTIMATVEMAGLEIKKIDGNVMIVEKHAIALEVADKEPKLADIIIKYNHYLLRGNLKQKRELLKQLADALSLKPFY